MNLDQSISDITNFDDLTISDYTNMLNLLNINLPMYKSYVLKVLDHKFYAQKVPGKSVYSEEIWRYLDKIQVITMYNDVLRPAKEVPVQNITKLLNELGIEPSELLDVMNDFTNLFDVSNNPMDQSFIIFNTNVTGDLTDFIPTWSVPA
jgi:hypothetical protein